MKGGLLRAGTQIPDRVTFIDPLATRDQTKHALLIAVVAVAAGAVAVSDVGTLLCSLAEAH